MTIFKSKPQPSVAFADVQRTHEKWSDFTDHPFGILKHVLAFLVSQVGDIRP